MDAGWPLLPAESRVPQRPGGAGALDGRVADAKRPGSGDTRTERRRELRARHIASPRTHVARVAAHPEHSSQLSEDLTWPSHARNEQHRGDGYRSRMLPPATGQPSTKPARPPLFHAPAPAPRCPDCGGPLHGGPRLWQCDRCGFIGISAAHRTDTGWPRCPECGTVVRKISTGWRCPACGEALDVSTPSSPRPGATP